MDLNQLTPNIGTLKIPYTTKKDLDTFLRRLTEFYREDLISIMAFGSCVSGDYDERVSDVNLMVVYSDLNIADLTAVAHIAQEWLKKRNFAPRFLSRRNLLSSDKFFQVDMLQMKDAHVILLGEDLIANTRIVPAHLHWQLSYEIKAMRARIKQQFWRTAGDERAVRWVLVRRFSSLVHLIRALLYLMGKEAPIPRTKILEAAHRDLGIDENFIKDMLKLRTYQVKLSKEQAVRSFTSLMQAVRTVDEHADAVRT
ncbi:MAG: hypothetical protein AB1646_23940 [Thermodesulfobacteriota bacterium]